MVLHVFKTYVVYVNEFFLQCISLLFLAQQLFLLWLVVITIYLSKVLSERFFILYKTQTKEDIKFYILTLV